MNGFINSMNKVEVLRTQVLACLEGIHLHAHGQWEVEESELQVDSISCGDTVVPYSYRVKIISSCWASYFIHRT